MLVARVTKEPTDFRRVIIDWTKWLDAGEKITTMLPSVSPIKVIWPTPAPDDPSPLAVFSVAIQADGTQIVYLFQHGTPGIAYLITTIAIGSSGRIQTVEVILAVRAPPGSVQGSSSGGNGGGSGGGGNGNGGGTGGNTGGAQSFTLDQSLLDGSDLLT